MTSGKGVRKQVSGSIHFTNGDEGRKDVIDDAIVQRLEALEIEVDEDEFTTVRTGSSMRDQNYGKVVTIKTGFKDIGEKRGVVC